MEQPRSWLRESPQSEYNATVLCHCTEDSSDYSHSPFCPRRNRIAPPQELSSNAVDIPMHDSLPAEQGLSMDIDPIEGSKTKDGNMAMITSLDARLSVATGLLEQGSAAPTNNSMDIDMNTGNEGYSTASGMHSPTNTPEVEQAEQEHSYAVLERPTTPMRNLEKSLMRLELSPPPSSFERAVWDVNAPFSPLPQDDPFVEQGTHRGMHHNNTSKPRGKRGNNESSTSASNTFMTPLPKTSYAGVRKPQKQTTLKRLAGSPSQSRKRNLPINMLRARKDDQALRRRNSN